MNIDEKAKLYERVRSSAGAKAVKAKLYEECEELTIELGGIMNALSEFECGLDELSTAKEDYISLTDEIADVIITMEQNTGNLNMLSDIQNRVNYKLNRLSQRYIDGQLMYNLDMSTVK